jgi:hypothetical protein
MLIVKFFRPTSQHIYPREIPTLCDQVGSILTQKKRPDSMAQPASLSSSPLPHAARRPLLASLPPNAGAVIASCSSYSCTSRRARMSSGFGFRLSSSPSHLTPPSPAPLLRPAAAATPTRIPNWPSPPTIQVADAARGPFLARG